MIPNFLLFFNIGGGELILIVLVIIIFFGSKQIPEIARMLGKGIHEIKNATNDIQHEIKKSVPEISQVKDATNIKKQVTDFIIKETTPNSLDNKDKTPIEDAEETNNKIPPSSIPRN